MDYASGATVTTMLCQVSSDSCLVLHQIEARDDHDPFGLSSDVRVGAHAWDRSYVQSYVGFTGSNLNTSIEWSGGSGPDSLNGMVTLVDHVGSAVSTASTLQGFVNVGNGYCVDKQGNRPQTYLCDDSGAGTACNFTTDSCWAVCRADSACTGFMLQDMSMYGQPTTCQLVTSRKPTSPGNWVVQNQGSGFAIDHHDTETRDTCYKKTSGPSPSPPGPSPSPSPGPQPESDFVLVLQARFAWWRAGTVNASQDGSTLNFAPYGRSAFALKVFGAATNIPLRLTQGMAYCPTPANTSQACIAFALDPSHAPVTFSTNPSASHDSVSSLLQSNRAATIDGLAKYGEYSWAAASVQAKSV